MSELGGPGAASSFHICAWGEITRSWFLQDERITQGGRGYFGVPWTGRCEKIDLLGKDKGGGPVSLLRNSPVSRRLVWLCAKMCELSELCGLSHGDTLFLTKMIKQLI